MHNDEVLKEGRKEGWKEDRRKEDRLEKKDMAKCIVLDYHRTVDLGEGYAHADLEKGKCFPGKNHVFLPALFFILLILINQN